MIISYQKWVISENKDILLCNLTRNSGLVMAALHSRRGHYIFAL